MIRLLTLLGVLFFSTPLFAQTPVQVCVNTNGNNCIPVNSTNPLPVTAGGSGGGTSSAFDSAFPADGTAIGISDGTNMKSWLAAIALGDGVNGNNTGAVANWLWNGATYDRARGDATNGAWVNVKSAVGLTATLSGSLPAGANNIGNVGGKTVSVCVTPTITTANAYGTNFVVGGLLTFANAFTSTGTGILQTVTVTVGKVETSGFTFTPFNSNPSNTTWTDAAAAAINAADVPKVRPSISLNASSVLGTHTVLGAAGLGQATAPGTTSLFGVLTTNATLTNNFTSTSEVQVCVTIMQDL